MLSPRERQSILRALKKGPDLRDRQMLADYSVLATEAITKRKLKPMVDKRLKQWRERELHGQIDSNNTFLY